MSEPIMMTRNAIEAMALAALSRAGASQLQAAPLARAIAAAEAEGLASHGLGYLATYCEHLGCGKVIGTAVPRVETPAPGVVVVDAGSGFAHAAIDAGFARLVPLARTQGIAHLAIRNSYNCGVLGYHTERLTAEGLVGLGFTNAPASIAPSGGTKPVVGTNPWSLAVPDGQGGAAIAIDQSASVVAKSEVIKRSRSGEPIPLGWALAPDGQPTTDASVGLKGTMVPAGGYKGVGSALLVEVMAACLSGATLGLHASPFSGTAGGPPKTGQGFIAIDPRFASGGAFAERITALVAAFTAEPKAHLPGAGRRIRRARLAKRGIPVDPAIHAQAKALAG
jgi:(2R)-3-sulfolactate dehydrogenase (NADP+)